MEADTDLPDTEGRAKWEKSGSSRLLLSVHKVKQNCDKGYFFTVRVTDVATLKTYLFYCDPPACLLRVSRLSSKQDFVDTYPLFQRPRPT